MAALNVFRQVGNIADSEFLAMDVLPALWSFSLGPLLNLQQFKEYMDLIKSLSIKIEQDQTWKLRDLASTSANGFSVSQQPSDLMSMGVSFDPFSPTNSTSDSDFERLVLGKPSPSNATTSTVGMSPFAAHPGTPTSPPFSWSSSVGPTMTSASNRAVTPDASYTMSSFRNASQPNTSISGDTLLPSRPLQQPLQPTSLSSNPWMSPPQTSILPNHSRPGNSTWGITQQQYPSGMDRNIGASPVPTPPQPQSMGLGNLGRTAQILQPAQGANAWGVPPPPSLGTGFSLQSQQQPAKKTGLDAYESLI